MLRKEFHPALPTFRFEGDYQKIIQNDVQGYRLNAEAGYLMFAGEFDWVHYFEKSTATQLRFMSPRLLIRSAPSRVFEIDLAMGAKIVSGRRAQTGFEFGLPFYFFIGPHVIVDIRNYFSAVHGANIYDGSFGLSGKWKLLGVRAAYRVIRVGSENLHGPEFGLFAQW